MSEVVIQEMEITLEPSGCMYDRLKLLRDKVLEAGQSMMVAGGPCERCKSLNYEQEFGECVHGRSLARILGTDCTRGHPCPQMGRGVALLNRETESGDGFGGTVSRSGPADLVNVWKCPQCGHSVTMTVEPPQSEEEQ